MKKRLESLDVLRGADLFFLLAVGPVVRRLIKTLDIEWLNKCNWLFDHVEWQGFSPWDIIMPLFMFMAGVSMPFSLNKYINGENKSDIYKRILKRFILLWVLGAVVQGNLLALDTNHIYLYSNTLQAIAAGYLITAIIFLNFKMRGIVIGAILLFTIYLLPMVIVGNYTPDGNFAESVDRLILGRFRDGVSFNEDGTWSFAPHYHYTWVWSSLNFAVTVMLGFLTGDTIRRLSNNKKQGVTTLTIGGIALIMAGLLLSYLIPIIKTIWSSSMTLFSGGICVLLMALFYYIVDYKGWGKGLMWLKIYGTNSIAAYVLGEVVNFRGVAHSVLFGLKQFCGDYYNTLLTFANFLILFLILRAMYKAKIFIKI